MSAGAGALTLVLAALAFAFALADSAVLAAAFDGEDADETGAVERRHRALAFARLLAQLGTGTALALALDLFARTAAQAALIALAAGMALVALTEVAAREIGDALGARALAPLRPLVLAAEVVLSPVVALAARLDESLRRALPAPPADEVTREETAEQFREIVAAEAEVTEPERALLAGVFTLGDTQVSEVMVPRIDVIGVERDTPWSEVVDRVRSSGHSRVPVYVETIDDIVGVLYAKDLLPAVIAGEEPASGWASLVRPPSYIPTTKRVDHQLRDFRHSGSHLAVVADEYGGTAGIVTIEDILEEIVGEIRDERDEEEAPVVAEGDRKFWVSARVTLDELSDVLGVPIEHEDVTTAGGLVYELLGRVPRPGESLTVAGFRVVVERVIRRRVLRLYFERLPEPAERAAAEVETEGRAS
ncbi:hemolysin family protein [Roseisolibacter sp. H3M3-2]|uniref:hemolysin family protein n=1 Tax=Roseisolibacter sp. H3M3-2 TaxID=3031323 RepID=UPI0023DCA1E6|nr:hemolysin family protein [Roseisolibacter sp. H3M3-2]MDF1502171.1 hemolysin family protein [Roseisolibacter sp. H3M3-2]